MDLHNSSKHVVNNQIFLLEKLKLNLEIILIDKLNGIRHFKHWTYEKFNSFLTFHPCNVFVYF